MSYGLLALLDDIAALAKMAAASVDDIATQAAQSGTKSLGIVIDDAAVTPQFVSGVSPSRELPAIWKIARWSLFNKLVIITPAALLLSAFLPGIIPPLLILGGLYLSFEGAEKVMEWTGLHAHHQGDEDVAAKNSAEHEKSLVSGAVRTDFILSSEIMVLTLAGIADQPLMTQIGVMATIAILFTLGVYGVVALIVRADDVGLALAKEHGASTLGRAGRALVAGVAPFLKLLGIVGTFAMLWVGGSLIIHQLAHYHIEAPEHLIHDAAHGLAHAVGVESLNGAIAWLVTALLSGIGALAVGFAIAFSTIRIKTLAR